MISPMPEILGHPYGIGSYRQVKKGGFTHSDLMEVFLITDDEATAEKVSNPLEHKGCDITLFRK